MYPYEGMFLLDPVRHAEDPEGVEKTVSSLLEKHGAKIHQMSRWDERRLAYEIGGHKRGVYLLVYFELDGSKVDPLRRESRIVEPILRQLILRLEDDIPTYLEKSAKYYDKMRSDQENRRSRRADDEDGDDRGGRDRDYRDDRDDED